jgi:ubiquinone/menaquinone biosynthesis C-methylase UbiE
MAEDYVRNYIKAIDNPLPELKNVFNKELEVLKSNSDKNSIVLDVGCGAGRPANMFSRFVKKIVCIDNDKKMLSIAAERCKTIKNIEILEGNALNLNFPDNSFDLVYATYNLVGSLKRFERQKLIEEMRRVAKNNAKVINITWKDNKETTEFLKKYYPSIDIDIIESDNSKTITSKGTFERISKKELLEYYVSSELKEINSLDIGSVWVAVIGTK